MIARLARALSAAGTHEVSGRAAQAAFFGLLAIFPGVLALLGLLPLLHLQRSLPTLNALTRRGLPRGVAELLLSEVSGLDERHGWALLLTLGIAIYYGGQSLGAMLSGIALAFDREEHHPLRAALVSTGLAGLLLVVMPVLLALLTFSSWLLSWVASLGVLGQGLDWLAGGPRWPLLCVAVQQVSLGLYRVGAGRPTGYRWISPGSVLAALGWAACTLGFETFVLAFSDLGATYGSVAAVIALMMYVNLIATLVLFGAEIDAEGKGRA